MIYSNKLLFNEDSKLKMIVHGLTKSSIRHALQHGAKVRFLERTWKSHAHVKVAYKDVGGMTKVDIIHRD